MKLRSPRLTLAALFLASACARADVVTVLSSNETQVGRPVALVYRFTDTEEPQDMPRPSILVDGLQINFQGASRQSNFSFSFGGGTPQNRSQSVFEYTYAVTPLRPGDFTIPGFQVRAGGKTVRTEPAKLRVFGPGGSVPPQTAPAVPRAIVPQPGQPLPPAQPPGAPDGREGEPYFGELLMSSKPVYVGEVVPVDIRFYFRGDVPLTDLQHPAFAGDGFTAVPLEEPQQDEQVIGNIPYRVFTFRSAITAVKTGEIEIPPVTLTARVLVSGVPPGFDAFFDQFFGNFPMPGIGRPEQVEVSTRGRTLRVLPLPREGRPAEFSGAVGQFSLEASADPTNAGPGEPITLSLQVSGRGNFDAMSPPVLTGTEGWRTYAPKEKFQRDDNVGSAGTKTFDFKMIARTDQTATPGAEFSYFDPRKKEYVTLKAEPQPVDAAGRGGVAENRSSPASAPSASSPDASAPQSAPPDDIAAPAATLAAATGKSFVPILRSPLFRWLNIAMLALALVVLPLLFWTRHLRAKNARASELERLLRQTKSDLEKAADRTDFYNAAARFVGTRLELLNGSPDSTSDVSTALQQCVADPVACRELQSVLARRDELAYGGGAGGALGDDERRRVVSILEKFHATK